VHHAVGIRLPQGGQPTAQCKVSLSGAQLRVQSPSKRAQLQLTVGLQRAMAIVTQLYRDHATLRLRLPLQIAQCYIAIARAHDRAQPLRMCLQLQWPATLQQRLIGPQLQLAKWPARRYSHWWNQAGKLRADAYVAPFDLMVWQALHGAGEIQLRPMEVHL